MIPPPSGPAEASPEESLPEHSAPLETIAAAALLDESDPVLPEVAAQEIQHHPVLGPEMDPEEKFYDALALRGAARPKGGDGPGGSGSPAADAAEAAPPPEPLKQGHLKIHCPNCHCEGELPWSRMDSTLCCAKCWHWYRVDTGGKLIEVPAPQKFARGALRFHRSAGPGRTMVITPQMIRKKRRAWNMRRGVHIAGVTISDTLVLWLILLYMIGLTSYIVVTF